MNDILLKTALWLMTAGVAALWAVAILVSGWVFPSMLPLRGRHALCVGAVTFTITTAVLWIAWRDRMRR